ncbi:hypothetical protein PZ938_11970 [Luteipulveratus sp. YIM 133132]|nr:hypothetical protein [Luteipulveratus sp. YIM 133132]MDE9366318.1 hypothetical protein [Luteipulveratus sp. YIM 133132]
MTPADRLPFEPLEAGDVARTVIDALQRPDRAEVAHIVLRPAGQPV